MCGTGIYLSDAEARAMDLVMLGCNWSQDLVEISTRWEEGEGTRTHGGVDYPGGVGVYGYAVFAELEGFCGCHYQINRLRERRVDNKCVCVPAV
jgi:hypothetical protein